MTFFFGDLGSNNDINDAPLLAGKINKSLKSYDLRLLGVVP